MINIFANKERQRLVERTIFTSKRHLLELVISQDLNEHSEERNATVCKINALKQNKTRENAHVGILNWKLVLINSRRMM